MVGVRATRDVREPADVARQGSTQLVDARRQRFEMIAVLDARVLDNFLQALAVKTDRVHAEDRVVIKSGEFGACGPKQFVQKDVRVHACLFHNLSGNFTHDVSPLLNSVDS